ncbi:MAG: Gfo/Idh/MocA family protein [Planctomycetota bacterium]
MPEKVRWGVLSTAQVGRNHVIPAIQASDNGRVVAIASRSLERAEKAAEALDVPRAYEGYERVLSDSEVDAVYNPLPVSMHAEWSIRCAEAGKPCLCEKPIAANADEARRMVDAFERRDLTLGEALMYRHHPLTRAVKRMVDDGEVGELRSMEATFCALCPGEHNIRWQKELAGGAMRDVGCYCVSVMRLMTGEEPVDVCAGAGYGAQTGVDEWVSGALVFPSGSRGAFCCALGTEFGCHYDLYGTEGRIWVEKGVVPGGDEPAVIRRWRQYECEEIEIAPADHYRLMVEDFAGALLEGREPAVPPQDAVANMAVIDEVLADARRRGGA